MNQAAPDNCELKQPTSVVTQDRLTSLDAFRGLTILAMILVDKPGSWDHLYWPMAHAEWLGWTPTDLVFPFFVYIVGSSLAFSLKKYRGSREIPTALYQRIARRSLVLIVLGLALNHFHVFCEYVLGDSHSLELGNWRFPGVLQRIAVVYLLTSLVALKVGLRGQLVVASACLFGYWGLLTLLPDPAHRARNLLPERNVVRLVDRAIISSDHLYTQGTTEKTDPEGLLSTMPAIVTALCGYWAAVFIQTRGASLRTAGWLAAVGMTVAVIGLLWGDAFPISKKLWTSSFVMLTGGLATVAFAMCLVLFDVLNYKRAAKPLAIVGVNALFVYVASWIVEVLFDTFDWHGVSLKTHLYGTLFTSWIQPAELASLAFAVATVVFWWFVVWLMSLCNWRIAV